MRRPIWTICAILWLFGGVPRAAVSERPRALTSDGLVLGGRFIGTTPETLIWETPDGDRRNASQLQRIEFPAGSPVGSAQGPLRRIVLRGGESLAAVLVKLDKQAATLMIGAGGRVTVPRAFLVEVAPIAGLRDVLYEDFERDSADFEVAGKAQSISEFVRVSGESKVLEVRPELLARAELPVPIESGRFQLRFQPADSPLESASAGLELVFGSDAGAAVLRIMLGGPGVPAVHAPPNLRLATQVLPRGSGWQRLVVQFDESRLRVLIDEHVLASGAPPPAPLSALRIFGSPSRLPGGAGNETARESEVGAGLETTAEHPGSDAATGSPDRRAGLAVDDILVQREAPTSSRTDFAPTDSDVLELNNGDRLFGLIRRADGRIVEIEGLYGLVERRWSEVSRVALHVPEPSPSAPPVAGLWARVDLQPPLESHHHEVAALEFAIQSASDTEIRTRHPFLGELRFAPAEIRRIIPRFVGTRLLLDGDVHHLGDETRAGFRRPVPTGTALTGEFVLRSVPEGAAYVTVHVADLEPCGPETPLGSAFLRELRDGYLGTDVIVNGSRLGRLNDQLRWRSASDQPQRVRIAVPAGLLRPGRNTWRIEQQSARDNPHEFDDAEVGPVAVEFE